MNVQSEFLQIHSFCISIYEVRIIRSFQGFQKATFNNSIQSMKIHTCWEYHWSGETLFMVLLHAKVALVKHVGCSFFKPVNVLRRKIEYSWTQNNDVSKIPTDGGNVFDTFNLTNLPTFPDSTIGPWASDLSFGKRQGRRRDLTH